MNKFPVRQRFEHLVTPILKTIGDFIVNMAYQRVQDENVLKSSGQLWSLRRTFQKSDIWNGCFWPLACDAAVRVRLKIIHASGVDCVTRTSE